MKPAATARKKPATRPKAEVATTEDSAREPRGARRRRETRARLLNAALKLMAARGVDGVAINEITEEADVGFGSFYNHFSSKEDIHTALTEQVFEQFADALDRALEGVTDPAEIMAASIRHTLYRAREDRTWARFLLREGLSARMLTRGLGLRLFRDLQKGIAADRFDVDDAMVAFVTLGGSALSAIALEVEYGAQSGANLAPEMRRSLAMPSPDLPERVSAGMLRVLGIPLAEARRIARRPLAALEEISAETG